MNDVGKASLAMRIADSNPWSRLAWLAVFAAAMGLLEAICVIYIRWAFPVETHFLPPEQELRLEVIREACTIVMLVGAGWLTGFNASTRFTSFFFAFGVWDILYYVGLYEWANAPSGLMDWDCLFLIPEPWYGPILAPVLISVYFMAACCFVHVQELRQRPIKLSLSNLSVQFAAASVWYLSFVKDSEKITRDGFDGVQYSWPLFLTGTAIGVAGLFFAGSHKPLLAPKANRSPMRAENRARIS